MREGIGEYSQYLRKSGNVISTGEPRCDEDGGEGEAYMRRRGRRRRRRRRRRTADDR